MKRNHIHFAPDIPGGNEVISGKYGGIILASV